MKHLIDKSALVAEIKNRRDSFYSLSKSCEKGTPAKAGFYAQAQTLEGILSFLDTLEVKEVNEVPATVMVNKYGNRFISSWSGLKEYDDLKEGQEIKILIPKK